MVDIGKPVDGDERTDDLSDGEIVTGGAVAVTVECTYLLEDSHLPAA